MNVAMMVLEKEGRVLLYHDSRCAIQVENTGIIFVQIGFMTDWITEVGLSLLLSKELSVDYDAIVVESSRFHNSLVTEEFADFIHALPEICCEIKENLLYHLK